MRYITETHLSQEMVTLYRRVAAWGDMPLAPPPPPPKRKSVKSNLQRHSLLCSSHLCVFVEDFSCWLKPLTQACRWGLGAVHIFTVNYDIEKNAVVNSQSTKTKNICSNYCSCSNIRECLCFRIFLIDTETVCRGVRPYVRTLKYFHSVQKVFREN